MSAIETALADMQAEFPAYTIMAGEDADGFWVRAERTGDDWVWERHRLLTLELVTRFTREALA